MIKGNYSEATKLLDKVLSIDSGNEDALSIKELAMYSLDGHNESIGSYDKILAVDPNDRDALYDKGIELRSFGNYTGAHRILG